MKLDPENYEAIYDYGCALADLHDYENAFIQFNKSLEYKADWADPYYEKAKIYFLTKETELGLEMLETAFFIKPEDRFEYVFEDDWQKIIEFLVNR